MKNNTPLKAIRAKCIDCCAGSPLEIRACPASECPLWEYRLGKNARNGSNLKEVRKIGVGGGSKQVSQKNHAFSPTRFAKKGIVARVDIAKTRKSQCLRP